MYTEQLIIRDVSQDVFSRLVLKSNGEGKREARMVEKKSRKAKPRELDIDQSSLYF